MERIVSERIYLSVSWDLSPSIIIKYLFGTRLIDILFTCEGGIRISSCILPLRANLPSFADFIAMPSNNIIKIPKDFNVQQAALTEPSAVALHAINLASKHSRTKINHSNILIIGGGAIGLLVALILKSKGANRTTILDTNYKRLEACQKASSSIIAHPDDKKIKSKNYEIIFDAVGYEITRNKSLECVKQGGIVVHIGLSQKAGEFDFLKLTRLEIILIGSFAYTNNEFNHSLNMLFKGVLCNLSWLNYLPLKEGAAAFKEIHEGKISAPKIILIP